MENWNDGMMEKWNGGMMEVEVFDRNPDSTGSGTMEWWKKCKPFKWSKTLEGLIKMSKHGNIGRVESWKSGILLRRSSLPRSSGEIPIYRELEKK